MGPPTVSDACAPYLMSLTRVSSTAPGGQAARLFCAGGWGAPPPVVALGRSGRCCHPSRYLHPFLSQVILSAVDTQCVGLSVVSKPHPVVPPLVPLCTSLVGTCFTAIVIS